MKGGKIDESSALPLSLQVLPYPYPIPHGHLGRPDSRHSDGQQLIGQTGFFSLSLEGLASAVGLIVCSISSDDEFVGHFSSRTGSLVSLRLLDLLVFVPKEGKLHLQKNRAMTRITIRTRQHFHGKQIIFLSLDISANRRWEHQPV